LKGLNQFVQVSPERRLVGISRSQGCLLPCASSASVQALSQVRVPREGVSIQGPSLRTLNRPKGLHQNIGSNHGSTASKRNSHLSLS
jgi:hypothetical protein